LIHHVKERIQAVSKQNLTREKVVMCYCVLRKQLSTSTYIMFNTVQTRQHWPWKMEEKYW